LNDFFTFLPFLLSSLLLLSSSEYIACSCDSVRRRYNRGEINADEDRSFAMPKFLIERELPGAGKLSPEQLQGISQKSCSVLRGLGPQIQWLHSYVTGDKIYCVYIAPDEDTVRKHAEQGGFPANKVSRIQRVIDPTTAE
jgi:hypothetical protein